MPDRPAYVILLPELAEILAVDPDDPDVLDVVEDMERQRREDPEHEARFLAESEDEILEYVTSHPARMRELGRYSRSTLIAARGVYEYWRAHQATTSEGGRPCTHPSLPLCGGDHPGGPCEICAVSPGDGDRTGGPWHNTDETASHRVRLEQVAAHYRRWGLHPDAHVCGDCGGLVLVRSESCPNCILDGGRVDRP